MKSKKEVEAKILRLQLRLEQDKEDIKDNLSFAAILGGLIPAGLKVAKVTKKGWSAAGYLKDLASKHISAAEPLKKENWFDKLKAKVKDWLNIKQKVAA